MSTLLIEGGRRLSGRITVDGNKNSALPLVAACLLSDETCRLENVPRISDIRVMADLLTGVGARVSGLGTPTLEISTPTVTSDTPDAKLVGRLRGSVLLMGPLLARTGRVRLAPPGGDFPTRRTIATHVQALVALGARVVSESGYELDAPDGLRGASFYLDEASVTGTETAVLAAAAAEGVSEIRHAATEPHVVELCEFLQAMGVADRGRRHVDDPDRRTVAPQGRDAPPARRLHRSRQLGGGRGHHRRHRRGARRAGGGHGADHRRAAADEAERRARGRRLQGASNRASRPSAA